MNSVNAVYALLDGRDEWLDAAEPAVLTLDKQRLADKEPSSALGYVKQTVPLGDKAKTPKTLVVNRKPTICRGVLSMPNTWNSLTGSALPPRG